MKCPDSGTKITRFRQKWAESSTTNRFPSSQQEKVKTIIEVSTDFALEFSKFTAFFLATFFRWQNFTEGFCRGTDFLATSLRADLPLNIRPHLLRRARTLERLTSICFLEQLPKILPREFEFAVWRRSTEVFPQALRRRSEQADHCFLNRSGTTTRLHQRFQIIRKIG